MKKLYFILFFLTGSFIVTSQARAQETKVIPEFSFTDMAGNQVTKATLAARPGMFMYFDPLCDVCDIEMKTIRAHMSYFNDKPLYLVSPGKKEDIEQFIKEHRLDKYPQITVIQDEEDQFYKLFKTSGYPSLFVFNAHKEITASFAGETYFEELQAAFEGKTLADNSTISTIDNRRAVPLIGF